MKKIQLKKRKKSEAAPSRITNETVAEHREQILAGGRRYKYPRQYARHKLVFNAIIISFITLVVLIAIGWWQLYPVQNTSTFFYRLTRIIPVPVASVDGSQVRYSDYLIALTGSKHYLEQTERLNLDSEDGKRQIEYMKRQSLDGAIADTYAAKLAQEKGITVSKKQIDSVIASSLDTVSGRISQEVYDDSTFSTLGYSAEEYRHIIRSSLLRQEVSYAIDTKALAAKKATEAKIKVTKNPSLSKIASELNKKSYNVQVASVAGVPKTNHDGGLSQAALGLKKGELSEFIRSTTGDGYYIVQLVSSNDTELSYNFLKIPLTAFKEQLAALKKNNKINEYIDVKSADPIIRR